MMITRSGLGAPDDAGEHVVATDGRAEQMLGAGRLLRAEESPSGPRSWLKPYGAISGAKIARRRKSP